MLVLTSGHLHEIIKIRDADKEILDVYIFKKNHKKRSFKLSQRAIIIVRYSTWPTSCYWVSVGIVHHKVVLQYQCAFSKVIHSHLVNLLLFICAWLSANSK